MCILASITAALLGWPLLAVLALRRTDRLASHPVLFAKTSHLFLDEYLLVGVFVELLDDADLQSRHAGRRTNWFNSNAI